MAIAVVSVAVVVAWLMVAVDATLIVWLWLWLNVELAVTSGEDSEINHKSCDLLRVGSNDFQNLFFRSFKPALNKSHDLGLLSAMSPYVTTYYYYIEILAVYVVLYDYLLLLQFSI